MPTAMSSTSAPVGDRTTGFWRALTMVAVCVFAFIAWSAAAGMYTPASRFGYLLGIAGTSMLALLLLYPARKRAHSTQRNAPLRHWFLIHMICGIAAPLLVLLHTTFRVRSYNGGFAMAAMVVVGLSGVIGTFFSRKIHDALNGARVTLRLAEESLAHDLEEVERLVQPLPEVKQEIDRFAAFASQQPRGWHARTLHFVGLEFGRLLSQRRISKAAARALLAESSCTRAQLESVVSAGCNALRAMQRVAQFTTAERVFLLWRVLHVPLVVILVISTAFHVVAVHMY